MSDKENDYQYTLNLPKTEFSMRAGLVKKEPAFLEQWEKSKLYEKIKEKAKGRPAFTLHDGPPYANGQIHIGHALNKILKDVIVKYKTLKGFDAAYLPGWDCHGLPIEHKLLKEMKKKKDEVDCVQFRKNAQDYALKYVDIQKEEFIRLGIFGEWDSPYLTLNKEYEYWILKSLAALNDKGYIYRGLKPVNWCFQCETALAEAEVEHEDHVAKSVHVKFKVLNTEQIKGLPEKNVSLLIWTTTPWTLIANVAVAVHGAFDYSFIDIGEDIVIIESSLSQSVLEKAAVKGKVIKEVKGEELVKLKYQHPFAVIENCPVVLADYVTKEDGTGLVHTAPGHGQDDFETGQKNNLDVIMPVNDRGVYTKQAGKYEGEHVFKANEKIIEDLRAEGVLFAQADHPHTYPHCWRCKKPIIFRATHQWFVKIDHENLRGNLKEAINNVQWIPEGGKDRISKMVVGRPDWCLSRQRFWGVPIPACKIKGEDAQPILDSAVINHFADIVKKEGTDAWFAKDIKDLIPKGFKCPETGGDDFEKTYDILDVWFDSGTSHQAVVKAILGKELPIDLYLEGSDQHRGWFQSSLITAVAMEGKAPYKAVLTHGFVVDGSGKKMSKSLGNVISPQNIIKNSGADILRLWVASSSYHDDVRISKEILDRLIDSYRKIRNTFRYILGNLSGFNLENDSISYDELLDIDQWALSQLSEVMTNIDLEYSRYDFAKVTKWLFTFCNEDLSSFYLDILKDRLYTSATNSRERKSAQTVLYHILNHLVRAIAPILPFTAEEIYQLMTLENPSDQSESVHLADWIGIPSEWNNAAIIEKFERLAQIRPDVLKALEEKRRVGDIGSSLEARIILKTFSRSEYDYWQAFADELPTLFIVSQVKIEKVESQKADDQSREIIIEKADGEKCSRCWNFKTDIGTDPDHSSLCHRCTEIVKESVHAD